MLRTKRIVAITLTIAMVLTMLPVVAFAQISGTVGDGIQWTLDDSGVLTISGSGSIGFSYTQEIPWYPRRDDVTTIIVEAGVTGIGSFAFYGCRVEGVSIADTVTYIGDAAFAYCSKLRSIDIPAAVTSIAPRAFMGCSSLERINVAEKNTNYCSVDGVLYSEDLTTLITFPDKYTSRIYAIPESVTAIGQQAFQGSSTLEYLMIPASVVSFAYGVFSGSKKLVSAGPIGSGCNIEYAWENRMPSRAFYDSDIHSVIIPESITSIGSEAFAYCNELTDIYYESDGINWEKISVADGNEPLKSATVHLSDGNKIEGEEVEDTKPSPKPLSTPVVVTGQGDGTAENPYRISSAEDFAKIQNEPNACYILTADLSISEGCNTTFGGTFDGNHHTISLSGAAASGLFQNNTGIIENLNIVVIYSGKIESVGKPENWGCISSSNEGTIRDCTVDGAIWIDVYAVGGFLYVGGITGYNTGEVSRCWNAANITINGPDYDSGARTQHMVVGGIVGYCGAGSVISCLNTGDIAADFSENVALLGEFFWFYGGGIAGYAARSVSIRSCIQAGKELELEGTFIGDVVIDYSGRHYYLFAGVYYDLRSGFLVGGEYNHGTQDFACANAENSYVYENSTAKVDYHDRNYYVSVGDYYHAQKSLYPVLTYREIEEWWLGLPRGQAENEDGTDKYVYQSLRLFREWDPEKRIAYWGETGGLGSQMTEETDTSFLENVDKLVGQYVLAEIRRRDDGMIAPDILLSIKPVETKTGTVTAMENASITIDGVAYSVSEKLQPLFIAVGDTVVFYLCDNELVGIYIQEIEEPEPEVPDEPEPEYRLVLSQDSEEISLELGQAVTITCNLYYGDQRITDWEQPQLSVTHSGENNPISCEDWIKLWSGSYQLRVEGVRPGTAYLTIKDEASGARKEITIEVGHLDPSEFDDASKAEWVEAHLMYAKSETYQQQIVSGFTGELEVAFNEIKNDRTIGAYNTLDQVNKVLAFEFDELSDTHEYELLLTQILFSRNGVTSIEETYDEYLSEMAVDIFKVLLDIDEFIAGLDNKKIREYKELLNALDNLDTQSGEFKNKLKELLEFADETTDGISEDCFIKLAGTGIQFMAGLTSEQIETYAKTTSECVMYLAAGEAYCKTSDTFGEMLLQMLSHLDIPSDLVKKQYPLVTEAGLLKMLDREMQWGNVVANPFDVPISIGELGRAIENFYTQMEAYKEEGAKCIAQNAVSNYTQGTVMDVYSTSVDVVVSFIECVPVMKVFSALKALFDGTQFVIDKFTGIDDKAYHGTMVMRLYCMAYIHYITLNYMAENTENWGKVRDTSSPGLTMRMDRKKQYADARTFDEAVAFYRAIRAVATEYAKAYYATPLLEEYRQYPSRFRYVNPRVAKLCLEQRGLDYEWCHTTKEEFISEEYIFVADPDTLLIYGLKCPIGVTVTNPQGDVIAQLVDNEWIVARGYEHYFFVTVPGNDSEECLKIAMVPRDYNVSFTGVDDGELNAAVTDYLSGETVYYVDIPISQGSTGHFADCSSGSGMKELTIDGITMAGEKDLHVHTYSEPTFNWAEDYSCTATFTCEAGDDFQTVYCVVTSAPLQPEKTGIVYTATAVFDGKEFIYTKTVYASEIVVASGSCGDNLSWVLTMLDVLTISGSGDMWDYFGESAPWGAYYKTLNKVIIEEGVTSIGDYAFFCMYAMSSIELPNTVERIGDYAFDSCDFTEIELPTNLTRIGQGALQMTGLRFVRIPSGVTYIGDFAFKYCEQLTDVWFTGDTPSIGGRETFETYTTIHYPEDNPTWDFAPADGERAAWNGMILYWDGHSHAWDEGTVTMELSDLADGMMRYICTECGHTYDEVIHKYIASIQNPDCTEQGYTLHTCANCGDSYMDSATPAKGHIYSAWYKITAPTCAENGLEQRDCVNCDHSETRVLHATGHSYGDWYAVTEATCTESGEERHDCVKCGYYSIRVSDALGHDVGEWYTVTAATCLDDGEERRSCSRCDDFETRIIEAAGHAYAADVIPPTCTEQGYTIYTCACEDSYVGDYVDALGHEFENGACIRCDLPDIVLGDVNGDGSIDTTDAYLIVMYYNERMELDETQLSAADVDGNGEVDTTDAYYIVMYYNEKIDSFPE